MTERNEQQIPGPIREQLIAAHPIRRLGIPDDVASAVLFLATDASSWISGSLVRAKAKKHQAPISAMNEAPDSSSTALMICTQVVASMPPNNT